MAKVLIADDEEALRLILSRQLCRSGHEVAIASDGMAALDLINGEKFDVIVSDMKMPRLDGLGLLEKALVIAPDTEFIILTGHGSLESAVEAFKTGHVFDYLLKPLDDISDIDKVVNRAAERHFLRSENSRLVHELQAKVTGLEQATQMLSHLADCDGLTALYNHKAIHRILDDLLLEKGHEVVSIMMIDMDSFKLINDTYGHLLGDHILRHLASALVLACDGTDIVGRCGGDEFMIVLPGKNANTALQTAAAIKQHLVVNPFQAPDGSRLPLALCCGISDTDSAGWAPASLVSAADAALYEGKHLGGDHVTLHTTYDAEKSSSDANTFDVLDSLVTAIDHKDHYTKQHSEDVTDYALKIAGALGFSGETLNAVRVAGLLHDIGKIGVPDFILRKPGKLTAGEYEVMKGHVTLSSLIIHGLPRMTDILDAVANHHERWDGKGYPRGIAAEDIPLLGRVMAVADAFSAMTTSRPYRSAISYEDALIEIEKGSGSQFDPELAAIFVAEMRQRKDDNNSDDQLAA